MTATVRPAEAPRSAAGSYDRIFYSAIALSLALTVFAGFASTYYLPLAGEGPKATLSGGPFTSLVHLHGALFTAWVGLFIIQTALVAQRRVRMHRRLGVLGGALAAAMIVVGVRTALASAARGAAPPGIEPLAFLIVPLTDMVLFAGFVGAALILRRDKETHKRLMLLAYVSIVVAAIARLPGVLALGPPVFFGLALLFIIAGAVYDFATRRRVHRVYVWGGAVFALSVPLRLAISSTGAWRAFAESITR
jgi:hypothetical protein